MNNIKINISLSDSGGETLSFTTLASLQSFCLDEQEFWKEKITEQKTGTTQSKSFPVQFTAANQLISLVDWVNANEDKINANDTAFVNQQIKQRHSQVSRNLQENWLYSGQPYTQAFIDCFALHGKTASEAFLLYTQKKRPNIHTPNTFDQLKGYIAAYEFEHQDSDLVKRSKSERVAISKVRKEFVEAKDQLFGDLETLKTDYKQLSEQAKNGLEQELNELKSIRESQSGLLEQDRQEHHSRLEETTRAQERGFESLVHASEEKIKKLERTYEELLRLKPAASYWAKAAKKFAIQAGFLSTLIVATVVIGLIAGSHFFQVWLAHEKLPINLSSLQGLLITATILAIYAYILRFLSKLAFSSFHLMRDAEEREQLTYLYLALSNERQVDEKSREIVLQSLFSRSETGLLAGEHGPTMPGLDIGQLLRGIR